MTKPGEPGAQTTAVEPPPVRQLPPEEGTVTVGTCLGTYEVVAFVAAGGMGEVYRARDRRLQRDVALKILHPDAVSGSAGGPRLLREAQAMARLSHPNVVTIYEVGTWKDQVFVAMEFVEGTTLRAWLSARQRSQRDILDVFQRAGRGLAAVHASGLVHRDFKPDNALLGADGRVRVSDFGLAGKSSTVEEGPDGPPAALADTAIGSTSGTPAYMAPEQHERLPMDARADQFAFCVALWEALAGKRPFAGETQAELRANVLAGRITELTAAAHMPAWVRAVLLRGLATRPEDRFPSMDALLDVLARDPAVRRRRIWLAVAALAAMVALFIAARESATRGDPCAGGESGLAGAWDPGVKAAVGAAFVAVPAAYAADTFDRVATRLDGYAGDWVARRREVCEATAVRHEQSEALLDRRMACLDERRDQLRALTSLWIKAADAKVIERAVNAAAQLDDLRQCVGDEGALDESLPTDPVARAQIAGLRARINEVNALLLAGKWQEAKAQVAPVVTDSEKSDYPPVLLAALQAQSIVAGLLRDYKLQEETLRRELPIAARLKQDALVADLWSTWISLVGYYESRPDEALAMQEVAETAVERAGRGDTARAELLYALGQVHTRKEELATALGEYRQAVALFEKIGPPDSGALSRTLTSLANAERRSGDLAAARLHHQRALEINRRVLGPEHPSVAGSLMNLGNLELDEAHWSAARDLYDRAIAIWTRSSPDGLDIASALVNLAIAENGLELYESALEHARRSVAIKERFLGPDSRALATSLFAEARALVGLERRDEARVVLARSAALLAKNGVKGADHADVLRAQSSLELLDDHPSEALELDNQALVIDQMIGGAASPDTGSCLLLRGAIELRLGQLAPAAADLESALMISAMHGMGAEDLGDAQFGLARARWAIAHDDATVVPLARAARAQYATLARSGARHVAEVDAWLVGKR